MTNRLFVHAGFVCLAAFSLGALLVTSSDNSGQALRLSDASLGRISGLDNGSKTVSFAQACAASFVAGGGVPSDCTPLGIPNGTKCIVCQNNQNPPPAYGTIQSGTTGGPGSFPVTGSVFACSNLISLRGGCRNGVCANLGANTPSCGTAEYQLYAGQAPPN